MLNKKWGDSLYEAMFSYVQQRLALNDGASKIGSIPFRKRSEHIRRVFNWTKLLCKDGIYGFPVDEVSLYVAAIFHDSGYALSQDMEHGPLGVTVYEEYLTSRLASEPALMQLNHDYIKSLIAKHSLKRLMEDPDNPRELDLLMEADLLDESGAMSLVWDCMREGAEAEQSYYKTWQRINNYSASLMEKNPMKTEYARQIWAEKQQLMAEFLRHYARDLGLLYG